MLRSQRTGLTVLFWAAACAAVLLWMAPSAQAQDPAINEVYLEQASRAQAARDAGRSDVSSAENRALILDRLAAGDRDIVTALLTGGLDPAGDVGLIDQQGQGNEAALLQEGGTGNLALLVQQGDRNAAGLAQIGERNIIGAYLTGDDNALNVTQQGNDNIYVLDFVGGGQQIPVLQQGNGNRAVQIGQGTQPFGIEQRGDNMEVVVRHNGAQ